MAKLKKCQNPECNHIDDSIRGYCGLNCEAECK